MTAEVIIGNGFGVVVAADTATTRGDNTRTYEGAEKILALPSPHSIAVLHAGKVLLHGVPLATFLDNWILTLSDKSLNRVSDYRDSFMEFLKDAIVSYTSEKDLSQEYLDDVAGRLLRVYHDLREEGNLTSEGVTSAFSEGLARMTELNDLELGFQRRLFDAIGIRSNHNVVEEAFREEGLTASWYSSIEGIVKYYFADDADDSAVALAQEWTKKWLSRYHPCSSSAMLTFVGYGEKEFLPACVAEEIDGYFAGHMFSWSTLNSSAERNQGGYTLLEFMGQTNEIWRFIREAGLDPHFGERIVSESVDSLKAKASDSETRGSDELLEDLHEAVESVVAIDHFTEIRDQIYGQMTGITDRNISHAKISLAGMNLKNLTSIAIRLVHLQNLAQDLRGELATVSSKVTAGVITKAHGFEFVDSMSIDGTADGLV